MLEFCSLLFDINLSVISNIHFLLIIFSVESNLVLRFHSFKTPYLFYLSIFTKNYILMNLNLTKPICFFDLETTGINITNDRIVEISVLKVLPNGKEERHTWLVNPTIPIPKEVTAIHGITDADVADKPSFKEVAKDIYNMIKDSDLAGFNSDRFDIP